MEEYLSKDENLFFKRGEDGKLLPEEIILELLLDKPKIKAIPLTRGKLQQLFLTTSSTEQTTEKQDIEIITKYCAEPIFTEEEVIALKPKYINAIVVAILSLSLDIPQKNIEESGKKKLVEESEDFLKKKQEITT